MARYMAFIEKPADASALEIELDQEASLAETTQKIAEEVGMEDPELYYTMSKFYAVAIFEAPDNISAERVVRNAHQISDGRAEVVPVFTPSEVEA